MANGLSGTISREVDQHIEALLTHEPKYTLLELLEILNRALIKAGYEEKQQVSLSALKNRLFKMSTSLEGRMKKTVRPDLQVITIETVPGKAAMTIADVWSAELVALVKEAQRQSLKIGNLETLVAHRVKLLSALQAIDSGITKSALENHLKRSDYGPWGLPEGERDELDRAAIIAVLKRAKDFGSKREFYDAVGQRLQNPVAHKDMVRMRLKKLGIKVPDFNSDKPEKVELPKKAREHQRFAFIWNNKRIRIRHEIQQALREQGTALPTWKEVWRRRELYNKYLKRHPEFAEELPHLMVRQYNTGEPKELHRFVEEHLDEWKFDRKRLKKATGLVVGCYQWGSMPADVIDTAKQYAAYHGYEFVAGLSQYGRIEQDRDTDELLSVLPEELRGHIVVDDVMFADFKVDCNTHLVQTSDVYLTDSVCEIAGEQSTIYLGTKQEMRHWMRLDKDYPACYLTTGSLNHPQHKRTRLGRNNKAVAVAKYRHEYAFIVLEKVTTKHGVFAIPRQLRATPEGIMTDIDVVHGGARRYTPTGHEHRPLGVNTVKCGDGHFEGVDEKVFDVTFRGSRSIMSVLEPLHVHTGDTFDNVWANEFRRKQPVRSSYLSQFGFNDIRKQLDATIDRLSLIRGLLPVRTKDITHEPSNHSDDWLKKWVNRGDLQEDPLNSPLLCELWMSVYNELEREGRSIADKNAVEEKSPFGLYVKSRLPFVLCPSYQEQDQVIRPEPGPLVIRRTFLIHGHVGPKGAETRSIRAFAGYNIKVAGGHVHSATRLNGHDQVGVMTKLRKHYVQSPRTNWTNSHLALFETGETAHLFVIYGRWYGDAVAEMLKKAANKNAKPSKKKKAA